MPQYLLAVHHSGAGPDLTEGEMQATFAAVDAYNSELEASGSWVFAGGLQPVQSATVVDATRAATVITDGPYVEAKEHLGGFWVVQAPDLDAALELARRGSVACRLPVEVRPFQEEPA